MKRNYIEASSLISGNTMRHIVNNIEVFSSFEDENHYEYERRKKMTPEQRMQEFAILQERRRGADRTRKTFLL